MEFGSHPRKHAGWGCKTIAGYNICAIDGSQPTKACNMLRANTGINPPTLEVQDVQNAWIYVSM